jgi:hypothetical protein
MDELSRPAASNSFGDANYGTLEWQVNADAGIKVQALLSLAIPMFHNLQL